LQAAAVLEHALSAQAKHAFVSKFEPEDAPPVPVRLTHTLLRQSRPALQVLSTWQAQVSAPSHDLSLLQLGAPNKTSPDRPPSSKLRLNMFGPLEG
jgi:hypothetical protein